MTEFEDPPRWADASGSADSGLGSLFRAARKDTATDQELEALATRLGPVLGPGARARLSANGALLAKVGAGVALVVLGVGGVHYAHSRAESRASSPAARTAPVAASPSSSGGGSVGAAATSSGDTPNTVEPASVPPPPSPVSAPSARSGSRPPPAGAHEGGTALDEAGILERARAALGPNPTQALALTSQHTKQFPHGVLAQEREVIAIAALRRLGRTVEAERRAENFDRSYPHSAHQRTVDAEPTKR